MKLKELESLLQDVATFQNPKIELEQYPTGPHLAARLLYTIESVFQEFEDNVVVDLGCGTGVLSIGSALLGASQVIAIDIDEDALSQAQENCEDFEGDLPIDFLNCDIKGLGEVQPKLLADIVVMNPPFGTRDRHADTLFLDAAFGIAQTAVYSLHKKSTRSYLQKLAGRDSRVANAEVLAELRYDLPAMYKFHRKASKDIEVDLWRFEIG